MVTGRIAHKIPGRMRVQLPAKFTATQVRALLTDLESSPDVEKAVVRGSYLIVEHADNQDTFTALGKAMSRVFPDFERWADECDANIAKAVADPWVNKSVPLGFLGLAIYVGMRNGALLAGESAFALGYVAFDLYWKFQQENVVKKIEAGLRDKQKADIQDS
jgi:hypothetical protein